jgi:septal ring factor EnvC (AmiA/AmiB activator)
MKPHLNRVVTAILFIAISFTPYWFRHPALGAKARKIGIVLVESLDVQSEPGKHGFLQKRLRKDDRVEIIKHHHGWLQILHGGEVGFIRDEAHLIKILADTPAQLQKEKKERPPSSDKQIETLKQQSENIQRQIETGKANIQKYSQKEIDAINRLNEVDFQLHKSRKQLSEIKSEIANLKKKIAAATVSSNELKKQIQTTEGYMTKRLVALYKLNRIGHIHVLASADSMHEFIQRKEALERILAYDEALRKKLEENRHRFKAVLTQLTHQKAEKNALKKKYNRQLNRIAADQFQRKKLLTDIRKQKSLELAAIESLKASAKELDQKIRSLAKQPNSASDPQKIKEKPIATFKGLLKMPVKGKIIILFGPYKDTKFNIVNFSSGIGIAALKGKPVRAVYGGKIVYSSWLKGYGNIIIIDHGTNYHSVYAHVEETFKTSGDTVQTGEVIATVGDTGSISGVQLHFEIRHHGKPLDPLLWLKHG